MENNEQRCQELFGRWYRNELPVADWPELQALLAEADRAGKLEPMMRVAYDQLEMMAVLSPQRIDAMAAAITGRKAPVRRLGWMKWAAAAVLLFVVCGLWFVVGRRGSGKPDMAQTSAVQDVAAPQTARAVITLADGSTVYLDSAKTGELATQGEVQLLKQADGGIAYNAAASGKEGAITYNTLTNPRGSRVIDLRLADGSRVWLDAASAITYPVAFAGNERKVSISGEAYFEVTPDKTKPFTVSKGAMTIEVLGTHFNVNAYDDEPTMRTTLLEGKVKVSVTQPETRNPKPEILQPGEQAIYSPSTIDHSRFTIDHSPDLEQIMSWRENNFIFSGNDIQDVMRQLARWYNVDVKYETKQLNRHFTGIISRNNNISAVLKMLQQTEQIHFRVENNTVTVLD